MNPIFDPEEPFPLLSSIEGTYEWAKNHSLQVDEWLGFKIFETEALIQDRELPWVGLAPEVLLTPYTEIRFMLSRLELGAGMKVVELGAGYARMLHVMSRHHSGVRYLGIEVVKTRSQEAQRVMARQGLSPEHVECRDLLSVGSVLPQGDVYFVYDLSSDLHDTQELISKIKVQAQVGPVTVVGRGRATRSVIERHHPWLSDVVPPEHFGNFSVYRS
jgi:hypothetical protein